MEIITCFASPHERRREMPGDSIIPRPMASITHAITIKAPPELVWPWLVQMGAGRGGWYSYDFIDNGGNPSAISILPKYQEVACGDVFPATPGVTPFKTAGSGVYETDRAWADFTPVARENRGQGFTRRSHSY